MSRRRVIAGVIATLVSSAGFVALAVIHSMPRVQGFDSAGMAAFYSLRGPILTPVFTALTTVADTPFVTVLVVTLVFALWRRGFRAHAVYAALVASSAGSIVAILKELFDRQRPPVVEALVAPPASMSFPSGHAMGGLLLGWLWWYLVVGPAAGRPTDSFSDRVRATLTACIAVLFAALAGASRVYLGVHWPSDVIASWFLGVAWIAGATTAFEWFLFRKREGSSA